MSKVWRVRVDGADWLVGTTEELILGKWTEAKRYVEAYGGIAQLISGKTMLVREYRKD